MTNLPNLIAQVESAEGPSRELFEEAFAVCFPVSMCWDDKEWEALRRREYRFVELLNAEAWTDSALSLLPEGWGYMGGENPDKPGDHLWGIFEFGGDREAMSQAATPALALLSAILKAKGAEHVG